MIDDLNPVWGLHCSGGTALLTYQYPIARRLVETRGAPGYTIGVSSGLLIAAAVGMGPAGLDLLGRLILEVDGTKWFQSLSPGKSGLFSLKPLREKIVKHRFGEKLLIPVYVGLTDMATGEFRAVLLNELSFEDRVDAIICSCTQPVIHETARFQGAVCDDGGVRSILPPRPPGAQGDIVGISSSPIEPRFRLPQRTQDEVNDAWERAEVAFACFMADKMSYDVEVLKRSAESGGVNLWIYAPKTWARVGKPFKASKDDMRWRLRSGSEDALLPPRLQYLRRK